jgi:hydroxyethylthiazole kinase-like uncharacterized protein yjeF
LATRWEHGPAISAAHPELLSYGVEDAGALGRLLENAGVVALGPGLGTDDWAHRVWGAVLDGGMSLVVDADGLNLLARDPLRRSDWVLTPHPGEAGRLLQTTAAAVQRDRLGAVQEIARRYGGVCILKGSGSLIADGEQVWLCDLGNPGMAAAGMGDILTGIVAGLMAQGMTSPGAATAGVWLHALAGDIAANQAGEAGLMATDLLDPVHRVRNNPWA